MKLLIDIPEEIVTAIQNGQDYRYDIHTVIAQGKPYDTSGDLISREYVESIVEELENICINGDEYILSLLSNIKNAPTVEYTFEEAFQKTVCEQRLYCPQRPQGECKSCRYRDPEDKKCDCGGMERQGCIFPVSDNYYCKYYERDKEE